MKTQQLIGIAFTLLMGVASLWAIWYYRPDLLITSLWDFGGISCLYYGIKNVIALRQREKLDKM